MYLIEIFLPLADNDGIPFPHVTHETVERELTERFGGVTAYPRAPATGTWKASATEKQQDDLVVFEVMCKDLERTWWRNYRRKLEKLFRQETVLIRLHRVRLL